MSTTRPAPVTTVSVTTTRPASVTTSGAPAPSGDDLLRRRNVRPEGVPAQLDFFEPSIRPCDAGHPSPDVGTIADEYRIGDTARICIRGFDASSHVAVEVAVPGGQTRQHTLSNVTGENVWVFQIGPTDPTGTYTVTAVQGAKRATSSFTAVLPAEPRIEALDPSSGAPGSVFRFAVVSPSPNQTLTIDLYRSDTGAVPAFTATLGTIVTDGGARGTYLIQTRSDSPVGYYCLVARPFANECASFRVR